MDKIRSESTTRMRPCPISYYLFLYFMGFSFIPLCCWLPILHPQILPVPCEISLPVKNGCCTLNSKGLRELGERIQTCCVSGACGVVRNGWSQQPQETEHLLSQKSHLEQSDLQRLQNKYTLQLQPSSHLMQELILSWLYLPPQHSRNFFLDFNESRKLSQDSLISNLGILI